MAAANGSRSLALAARARQVAGILDRLGVSPEGRVGSLGRNTANHVALYFGVPCTGRVLHTMNIRLSAEQLAYTADHAEDEIVFVDRSLLPLFGQYLPKLNTVNHVVVVEDGSPVEYPDDPRVVSWNDAVAPPAWPPASASSSAASSTLSASRSGASPASDSPMTSASSSSR